MNLGLTPSQVVNLHSRMAAAMQEDGGATLGLGRALKLLEDQVGKLPAAPAPALNLGEMQALKREAENHILAVVDQFNKLAGADVSEIRLETVEHREQGTARLIPTWLRLEVRL